MLLPDVGQRPTYDEYVIGHRRAAARQSPELAFTIPEVGQPYPSSSLPAQQVAVRVRQAYPERLAHFEDAVYRAMFTDLADVSAPEILRACARSAGVPEDGIEGAWADEAIADQVQAEHHAARDHGITGIPALWSSGRPPLVGAVPTAVMRQALIAMCSE